MGMKMRSNVDTIIANAKARERQVTGIMAEVTKENTKILYEESRRQMNEMIYDKPVPTKGEEQEAKMARQQAKGKVTGFGGKGMGFGTKGSRFGAQTGGGMAYKKNLEGGRGKKAWKRTGNLKRSEKWKMLGPYLGLVINDAGYAVPRHNKKNTRYPAPWRKTAIEHTREKMRDNYRKAFRKAMGAKL